MYKFRIQQCIGVLSICLAVAGCKVPAITAANENRSVPGSFGSSSQDTTNISALRWRDFFTDPYLVTLIDSAMNHNQELMITLQEVEIARNEIRFKQAPLIPSVTAGVGAGIEKVGRYTSQGAGDASTEIEPGKEMPDPLADFSLAVRANWEIDIWKKLRNAKKAAVTRYLSTVEGKNFVITNLIAEVANSYYELLALDNQLEIVKQNIELQKNALEILKVQKEAARATELAVQKFQAEVLKSQSLEFDIQQKIKGTENRINFLLGRFPQEIARDKSSFLTTLPAAVRTGIPSQLLANRPDIKQAEQQLEAAKLDVKVARAEFYPSFGISAALGFQAFKPSYLVKFPESVLYSLAGDLVGPLINRHAIKAEFFNANARQLQAMYNYERTILNAYLEVATQLSNISNLGSSYDLKSKQVDALTRSIDISNDLFKSARADYLEVLMTQRDALEAKLELIETKQQQMNAVVNVYRELGGGWK
ncbi:TolC family protein [Chitinophaga niabensis]|uniref:Efflux transporter, outer membrane factor (OMF) lipoprotein, NodT family n=1 Tax=Chitinophaga niabensis TaxID=536979 RepID=A0A1N6E0K6_9BACT|nr:TolC family protein [Chitinophaga niabensis]SIN76524.1 efflux transporter, outer membrane factor (OMF) lipoprotein, NodT family [Chitinophaga niabensis]